MRGSLRFPCSRVISITWEFIERWARAHEIDILGFLLAFPTGSDLCSQANWLRWIVNQQYTRFFWEIAGDPCPKCKKNVTRAQGGIQCRTCTKWFHFSWASVTYGKEATEKLLGKWQCHRYKEVTNTPKATTVGNPNSQRQHNQGFITVSTASTQSSDNNEP